LRPTCFTLLERAGLYIIQTRKTSFSEHLEKEEISAMQQQLLDYNAHFMTLWRMTMEDCGRATSPYE